MGSSKRGLGGCYVVVASWKNCSDKGIDGSIAPLLGFDAWRVEGGLLV